MAITPYTKSPIPADERSRVRHLDDELSKLERTLSSVGRTMSAPDLQQQAGTAYTLTLRDAGTVIERNSGLGNTVTIPLNATVSFPTGTTIWLVQTGAGQTTISPTPGVTLRQRQGYTKIAGQWGVARLYKHDTDVWILSGDLSV